MRSDKLTFKNKEGTVLSARMEWPASPVPRAWVIFAHCFTCDKNLNAVRHISKALAGRGFAVLSFDFTGLGQSEGEFAETNFSANVDDLVAAADFLKKEYKAPSLLIGHSLGGAAVIKAAARIDSVKAVATIGAPAEAAHVTHVFEEHLDSIEEKGAVQVSIGGRPFTVKQQFVDDLRSQSVKKVLGELKKSVLLLHSPQDAIVGINNAAELYQAARHPKSFISLDGADHLLSGKQDSQYAGEVIASWAQRYLPLAEKSSPETEHQTLALVGDKKGGYTTLIQTGKHTIVADEPEDAGGADTGPSPYQLLTSSLAACTAITLRMYANRKDMDVQEIRVHVNHSKRHCEDCEKEDARIDHFERIIEAEGDLDKQQLQRLVEIANKCPVHRTLEGDIRIDTRLKE